MPANSQSAGSVGYATPKLNQFDFLLTNEPNQFNCFMNSIIQVMWHCSTIKDSIQMFAQMQAPMEKGEAAISKAEIAKFKEY